MLGRFAARTAKNNTANLDKEEEKKDHQSNLEDYERVISGSKPNKIVRADH